MKTLTTLKLSTLALLALMSTGLLAIGAPPGFPVFYHEIGYPALLKGDKIRINDRILTLSPTVKVVLEDKKAGKIADVNSSRKVGIELIEINKRTLVDRITLLPEKP